MTPSRKSDLYFEEIGNHFEEWMSLYDVERRRALILKLLPPQTKAMSCLEIGCGTGKISETIAPLVGQLIVADISEALAQSVGRRLGVGWQQQDACALRLPSQSFDLVISSECIEHTAQPERALAEMARVLKKGGRLIVTSPNQLWFPVVWLAMATGVRRFAGNENWLSPWRAARVLKQHGILDLRRGGCHLFPWQLPLARRILPFFDRYDRLLYPFMLNYGIGGTKA